jgi:ABC-type branched-subunit amino acid transport system substrate-binding protein
VALFGPGPTEQLQPVIDHLTSRSLSRWALVGSDYIWPRSVHAGAVPLIRDAGADVVGSTYVPLGSVDPEPIIEGLRRCGAQAVLLSLVGRDLATFNRAFAASGLLGRVVRVSGALDETGLLEIDGDDSGELYAAMEWFAADPDEDGFVERYAARWGPVAPPLGEYAHGCYAGLQLLAQLARQGDLDVESFPAAVARRRVTRGRLARADGIQLLAV